MSVTSAVIQWIKYLLCIPFAPPENEYELNNPEMLVKLLNSFIGRTEVPDFQDFTNYEYSCGLPDQYKTVQRIFDDFVFDCLLIQLAVTIEPIDWYNVLEGDINEIDILSKNIFTVGYYSFHSRKAASDAVILMNGYEEEIIRGLIHDENDSLRHSPAYYEQVKELKRSAIATLPNYVETSSDGASTVKNISEFGNEEPSEVFIYQKKYMKISKKLLKVADLKHFSEPGEIETSDFVEGKYIKSLLLQIEVLKNIVCKLSSTKESSGILS